METVTLSEAVETTYEWHELPEQKKQLVVLVHTSQFKAAGLNTTESKLRRLFDLGHPKIVIGKRSDESIYCRIHTDSVEVMKVITKTYL